jgi:hypothetical protein
VTPENHGNAYTDRLNSAGSLPKPTRILVAKLSSSKSSNACYQTAPFPLSSPRRIEMYSRNSNHQHDQQPFSNIISPSLLSEPRQSKLRYSNQTTKQDCSSSKPSGCCSQARLATVSLALLHTQVSRQSITIAIRNTRVHSYQTIWPSPKLRLASLFTKQTRTTESHD